LSAAADLLLGRVLVLAGEVVPGEELLEDLGHDPYARAGGFCDAHAQPLRFKPDGCRLQHRKFDAAGFLRLIRGRRVALLGDSVTRQWFEYLLGRLRRHAAPGGIVNIPYGQPSFSRPGCSVVPASRNQTTGPGRISLKCYTVRAGTTRFCHRFSVPGTRNATAGLCYIYANRDPLDEQNLPAFNALGRGDVVVASTGLHMNFAKLMQTTMQKFVKHLPLLKAVRKDRPIMVWRESSAQHFRFKPSGYWPPIHWVAQRQALRNVNPKTFRCSEIPLAQLQRFEFRNRIARKAMQGLRIPVLPIWRTTALEHLAHPQSLRGGRSADCTHFCPKAGGMFEMWSHMFYNFLVPLLKDEEHFSNQFAEQPSLE